MRRVLVVGGVLLGMLAGCGAIIGVDETYVGPTSAGSGDGGTSGTDGSLLTTSTSTDASSLPIAARPVPFPCDGGAWALDCGFGGVGSVALADQALAPAILAPPEGGHLYMAVTLAGTELTSVLAVLPDGGEPRELTRFTGTNLRDLQSSETVTTATETLAYVYALLGTEAGPAQLYSVLWNREETTAVSDQVLPGLLQALPAQYGGPVGIAHVGSFFNDLNVMSAGTDGGPVSLDVGYAADQTLSVKGDYSLQPLIGASAVAFYTANEDEEDFWITGPTAHGALAPGEILFDDDQRLAFVATSFVAVTLDPIDETTVVATGAAAADAAATSAPFVVAASLDRPAGLPEVDASAQPQTCAVVHGDIGLPFATVPAVLRVVAERIGPAGAPPSARVTVAGVVPSTGDGGDVLVLARYDVTPDTMLDPDAAVLTDDGAQVDGTATATLDPTFGAGGVATLPLGYAPVELGDLRPAAIDQGYYATLRVTLADGTQPTVVVHVRGDKP